MTRLSSLREGKYGGQGKREDSWIYVCIMYIFSDVFMLAIPISVCRLFGWGEELSALPDGWCFFVSLLDTGGGEEELMLTIMERKIWR